MFTKVNEQVARDINTVMANTPNDEPLAANLIPVAMNNAVSNEDLIQMMVGHFVGALHVLATGHTEHDTKPVGVIVSEVDALVSEALGRARESVVHTPDFYKLVRQSAARYEQQQAANDSTN